MPRDLNGRELEVGDTVIVRYMVKEMRLTENYCSVLLEPVNGGYPRNIITLDASQVEKV